MNFKVLDEPSTESIDEAVNFAASNGCDFVLSFGGGSVMDTGKSLEALLRVVLKYFLDVSCCYGDHQWRFVPRLYGGFKLFMNI